MPKRSAARVTLRQSSKATKRDSRFKSKVLVISPAKASSSVETILEILRIVLADKATNPTLLPISMRQTLQMPGDYDEYN
ncbi:hypothetical protein SDC9_106868 [bioreactor metagenome]|uniref:Uncharacterized protein n=1 Tax=bioreactor metagenome TaxID=1076179 RepID=A0A645B5Y1_9ZZZZ